MSSHKHQIYSSQSSNQKNSDRQDRSREKRKKNQKQREQRGQRGQRGDQRESIVQREQRKQRQRLQRQREQREDAQKMEKIQYRLKRLHNIKKNNEDQLVDKQYPKQQYRLKLLLNDEIKQFPHKISNICNSFNFTIPKQKNHLDQPYNLNGKYIPGNFIHKQFAAYFDWFMRKYHELKQTQFINHQKVSDQLINHLQKLIQLAQKYNLTRILQCLKKIKQQCMKQDQKIDMISKEIAESIQRIILNKKQIRSELRSLKKNYNFICPQFDLLFQQTFKSQKLTIKGQIYIEGYFQIEKKIFQSEKQMIQSGFQAFQNIRNELYKTFQKQFTDMRYLDSGTPKASPNFGLGRLSFVWNDQLILFQPIRKIHYEFLDNLNNVHLEEQIMPCARETIKKINDYQGEDIEVYKQFQQSKIIILDIFSQRSACSSNQNKTSQDYCRNYIPIYKVKQIENQTVLKTHQELFIRLSYHRPFNQQKRQSRGKIKTEKIKIN